MESKKGLSIPMLIVAIIVGAALYRQFDFQTLRFEKPALAVVYVLCLAFSIYVIVRGYTKRVEK